MAAIYRITCYFDYFFPPQHSEKFTVVTKHSAVLYLLESQSERQSKSKFQTVTN